MKFPSLYSLALFSSAILLKSCDGFYSPPVVLLLQKIPKRSSHQTTTGKHHHAKFKTTNLQMSIPDNLDTLTSGLASISRLPFGTIVSVPTSSVLTAQQKQQATAIKILRLYDMEGNSDCRLVRERITELDLCVDVVIPAGRRSRALTDSSYEYYIGDASGIALIPSMMVSEEDGVVRNFVGSEDILEYLSSKFGPRNPIVDSNDDEIKKRVVDALVLLSEPLPSLLRLGRGQDVAGCALSEATPRPVKPLILYSYEGNQFCRLVREVLCELDIPFRLVSSGKGSQQRVALAQVSGSTQCPYLVDPNTNVQMAESKAIIEYLYQKYAIYTPPNEALGMISGIITPFLKPLFKVLAPLQAGSNRENKSEYTAEIESAKAEILEEISSEKVVIYTYSLSPFCKEALKVLDRLEIPYKEISLGLEWVPFLIQDKGAQKRVALGEISGQTSLPNIFVNGKSIGGLYEGLLPALEKGAFQSILKKNGESDKRVESMEGVFE